MTIVARDRLEEVPTLEVGRHGGKAPAPFTSPSPPAQAQDVQNKAFNTDMHVQRMKCVHLGTELRAKPSCRRY